MEDCPRIGNDWIPKAVSALGSNQGGRHTGASIHRHLGTYSGKSGNKRERLYSILYDGILLHVFYIFRDVDGRTGSP